MNYDFETLKKITDEATARPRFYTDFDDVDPTTLHQIEQLSEWLRTKGKGSDVREVIAQLFERVVLEASRKGNANLEVAKARGNKDTLAIRLDDFEKELATAIASLNSIVDAGTESTTETKDARVSAENLTHFSLGKAIRSQVNSLYNSGLKYVKGFIDLNGNNVDQYQEHWVRTNEFYSLESIYSVTLSSQYGASAIAYYDINKQFISGQGGRKLEIITKMTPPANAKYVRFSFRPSDEVNFILTDFGSGVVHNLLKTINSIAEYDTFTSIKSTDHPLVINNHYISKEDNTVKPLNYFAVTDFINIEKVVDVRIPTKEGNVAIVYYDWNKNAIDRDVVGVSEVGNTDVSYVTKLKKNPKALFVRFSMFTNSDFLITLANKKSYSVLDKLMKVSQILGVDILTYNDASKEKINHYIDLSGNLQPLQNFSSFNTLFKVEDVVSVNIKTVYQAATIAYYDDKFKFVGKQGGDGEYFITDFAPPTNAKYVRFCMTPFVAENSNYIIIKNSNNLLFSLESKNNSSVIKNQWTSKKVAFIGDSITNGEHTTEKVYREYLAEKLGFTQIPYAVSGASVKDMLDYAKNLKREHSDIDAIFVFGGTNDYNADTVLGKMFELRDVQIKKYNLTISTKERIKNKNNNEFYGRLNILIEYLKQNFPQAQIIFMTPLHRDVMNPDTNSVQPGENFANRQGLFLDEYVEAVKTACKYWSVPVIDLYSESGIYPLDRNQDMYFEEPERDRLHPNAKGHKRIADVIEYKIRTLPATFRE